MKTLTTIHFKPQSDAASLQFRDGSFGGHLPMVANQLTPEQQAAKDAAIAWLSAVAGTAGFTAITDIWLTRKADIVTAWSEDDPPEVVSTSPAFVIGVWGQNAAGLIGGAEIPSVPGPETTAMAGLWAELESLINA